MAVLSAIAEAPSITDKSKRFIVTERNVRQASFLVRQCYQSLVSWLDMALKVQAKLMAENSEKQVKAMSSNIARAMIAGRGA